MNALLDAFLEEHVSEKLKPSTARDYQSMIERLIRPKLGILKVEATDHRKIAGLHRSLRSTPRQGNYVASIVSKVFAWGERHGFPMPPGGNPARGIERYREVKKERYLSGDELARLGAVLAEAEQQAVEMPSVIAAIRLLIFTGCRMSEILTLQWVHVDFDRACLRLPDSKTGAKMVHVNAPAMAVLGAIDREGDNPFVIVGRRAGQHLVNLEKPWRRIRATAGLDDVRLHDLRHTHASFAAGAGFGLPIIGKILGHNSSITTARYAHLADDPVKQASNTVGQRLADAMRLQPVEKKIRTGL
ncbi:MAG: site-specific integrase [Alphaproteobacteria bacterium]|nr:site-specific integrase [Alphaproteobacteria bacterium]